MRRVWGMIRAGRSSQSEDHLTPSGILVSLESETWWLGFGGRNGAGALTYRRPTRVGAGIESVAVHDYNGIARLVALLLLVLIPLMRRIAR